MTGGRLCCSIMGSLVYCYTPPLFDSYQMMKAALIPESSINYTFQWLLGRTLRSYFHCPFKNVQIFYFQGKNKSFMSHLNFRDHNSGIKQEASTMTGSSAVSPLPCSATPVILLTVSALLASRHLLHLLQ